MDRKKNDTHKTALLAAAACTEKNSYAFLNNANGEKKIISKIYLKKARDERNTQKRIERISTEPIFVDVVQWTSCVAAWFTSARCV